MTYMATVTTGIEATANFSFGRTQQIFNSVEAAVSKMEEQVGTERLIKHVSSLPADVVLNHVDHHRNFIRDSNWGHDKLATSHTAFLADFWVSCLAYVRVSHEVATHTASAKGDSQNLDARVYAAEALRGQFGKRAPYGLDARLDKACADVEKILHMLSDGVIDSIFYYLGTPVAYGVPTAEDLFCSDFLSANGTDLFSTAGLPETNIPGRCEAAASQFRRRHTKWSLALETAIALRTDADAIYQSQNICRAAHNRAERNNLIERLKAHLDEESQEELGRLMSEIAELNHLNLSLEPLFSFKGGVGLLQLGQIHKSPIFTGDIEAVNALKWDLFEREKASERDDN